jgi:long-chain acyl-CoA synthetase
MNLVELIDAPVAKAPERIALILGERRTTYAELGRAVRRVAGQLVARGIGPRQRIPLLDDTGPLLISTVLAAARIGASAVPLHVQLTAGELRELMRVAACAPVGVAGAPYAEKLGEALGRPALGEKELFEAGGEERAPAPYADPDAECLALLTSGTTGLPKPVGITHRTLVPRMVGFTSGFQADQPQMVSLVCAPGVHIGGIGGVLVGLAGGSALVIQPRFDAGTWLELVERHGVNTTFLVPTMIRRILDHPRFDATDLSSLRAINYGAAAAPVALVEEMIRRFPSHVAFANVFGQTETTGAITSFGPEDHKLDAQGHLIRAGSVGKPFPGVEIRLVDPATGQEVRPGEVGELWVRSPFNAEPGWRRTGDLVRVDADGYLYPQGRLSDTINRGGEKFGPGEIEEVLRRHPAVADAAVAGLPDPEMGERVGAAIVTRGPLTREEVVAHCRAHLARFKIPERIAFVERIPNTALWKVSRKAIADLILDAS